MTNRNLIEFEYRATEDRSKTIESGHFAFKDEEFVVITQFGGNHSVEKRVTPDQVAQWRANPDQKYIYDMYIAWKDGEDSPVIGHPLKEWPAASPAQIKSCAKLGIRAVEELADIPDGKLSMIGMGGRVIRDKAREWLRVASDQGKVLEEISALKAMMEDQNRRNKQLEEENAILKLATEEKRKK